MAISGQALIGFIVVPFGSYVLKLHKSLGLERQIAPLTP